MFLNARTQDLIRTDPQTYPRSGWSRWEAPAVSDMAVFSSRPTASRGRLYDEEECPMRSPFARDRDRIIHSKAFRRLNYKTQVFLFSEGDHFRTRLTHSLEVAQIARSLARSLRIDEDLAEAISLSHDIGHSPFGHAGERALERALRGFGGFDHNVQTLRVLTQLDGRYAAFRGLNLSWETLEGLIKHNGPLARADLSALEREDWQRPNFPLNAFADELLIDLGQQAGPEAQAAAIADDIAYNNHDIDDGIRAGLFSIEDLREVPFVWAIIDRLRSEHERIDDSSLVFELNRSLIARMIGDVVGEAERRLAECAPSCSDDIRNQYRPVIAFSSAFETDIGKLRRFLHARVYRHERVMRVMGRAERIIEDLVKHYMRKPDDLPSEWRCRKVRVNINVCAEQIRDFIAGMTDRYAIDLHRSLFDVTPKLR